MNVENPFSPTPSYLASGVGLKLQLDIVSFFFLRLNGGNGRKNFWILYIYICKKIWLDFREIILKIGECFFSPFYFASRVGLKLQLDIFFFSDGGEIPEFLELCIYILVKKYYWTNLENLFSPTPFISYQQSDKNYSWISFSFLGGILRLMYIYL